MRRGIIRQHEQNPRVSLRQFPYRGSKGPSESKPPHSSAFHEAKRKFRSMQESDEPGDFGGFDFCRLPGPAAVVGGAMWKSRVFCGFPSAGGNLTVGIPHHCDGRIFRFPRKNSSTARDASVISPLACRIPNSAWLGFTAGLFRRLGSSKSS